jgi:hypothetical protein
LRKSIRKIPTYSVYNKIPRILKASQELGLFLMAQAQSQWVRFAGTDHHLYASSRLFPRYPMRLLFASIHCYLDPSSGAALCTLELLELRAGREMDCRVLTTGILDPERETSPDEVLATLELPPAIPGATGNGQSGGGDRPERERRSGDGHADGVQPRRAACPTRYRPMRHPLLRHSDARPTRHRPAPNPSPFSRGRG